MYGFLNLCVAVPMIRVANVGYNATRIIEMLKKERDSDILVFPELCLTGATCEGLFEQQLLISNTQKVLLRILDETKDIDTFIFLSAPMNIYNRLFNCRILINKGYIIAISPKVNLNHSEKRYFSEAEFDEEIEFSGRNVRLISKPIFRLNNISISFDCDTDIKIIMDSQKATVFSLGENLENMKAASRINGSTIIYCSAGFGESTTDGVYAGQSFIAQNGEILFRSEEFSMQDKLDSFDVDLEVQKLKYCANGIRLDTKNKQSKLQRKLKENPFLPSDNLDDYCENIIKIQTMALAKRMKHINCENLVIGVSGGLDSAMALVIACFAQRALEMDSKNIVAVTMPGFGTGSTTYNNAKKLMAALNLNSKEISIVEACQQHFKDIEHEEHNYDVVFENAQARERTQILFDIANKMKGMVLGTGDFTESALGFATYNGDHISNYNVNANLPKTVIKVVIRYICEKKYFSDEVNKILLDIVDTHISPELLPASESGEIKQKTEEIVGPYELNDFYLYYAVRHGFAPDKILWMAENAFEGKYSREQLEMVLKSFYRRFTVNQFKRNCATDGPSIFDFSFSPKSFVMPSDADNIYKLSP